MDYEIERGFFDEEGDTAKDWRHAEYVNFCAWVSPEDADKMEQFAFDALSVGVTRT